MVKSREDIIKTLQESMGENLTDVAISLIEDITDTFGELENKSKDTTNWKAKYEENDRAWKTKYIQRFTSAPVDEVIDEPEDKPKRYTFEELFQ